MAKRFSDKKIINQEFKKMEISLTKQKSVEDEIVLIESFKDHLISKYNRGKKIYVCIDGEKIMIAKSIVNTYRTLSRMINDRKNNNKRIKKVIPLKQENVDDYDLILFHKLLNKLKSVKAAIMRSPSLSEQYDSLMRIINDDKIGIVDKNNMMRDFINQNLVIINFLNGKVKKDAEEIEPVNDVVFDDLNDYHNETIVEEEKPVKKEKQEKPKNKTRNKRSIFKRVAASVAAAIVLLFGAFISKTAGSNTYGANSEVKSTQSTENNTDKKVSKVSRSSKKTKVAKKVTKKSKVVKKKNNITTLKVNNNSTKKVLGSKFKIKSNSKVYSNVSNSINHDSGYKPYYGYSDVREVVGCGVRNGSSLTTFVDVGNDTYEVRINNNTHYMSSKSAEKLISSLVKDGGKIESIAGRSSSIESGIEGYYDYDDIKMLQKK